MATRRDIFLSRATEDLWLVQQVLLELEDDGLVCWDASRDIPPGLSWRDVIDTDLPRCSALFVFVTPAANTSAVVAEEVRLAVRFRVPVVPIIVNKTPLEGELKKAIEFNQWESLTGTPEDFPDLTDLPIMARGVLARDGAIPVAFDRSRAGGGISELPPGLSDFRALETQTVTTLVATADSSRGLFQAPGLLVESLPALRRLVLIVGVPGLDGVEPDYAAGIAQGAALAELLAAHGKGIGRTLEVSAPVAISAKVVVRREQSSLRRLLRGIPHGPGTKIDITGGTVPMSLAVKRAAEATGHRVTYTVSDLSVDATAARQRNPQPPAPRSQNIFREWLDVTDSLTFGRYARPKTGA